MTIIENTVQQMPGEVNIKMIDDNDFIFHAKWEIDITDYQFKARIIPSNGEEEIPMLVNVTNPQEGEMNITITSQSILDISPSTNRWYLDWTVNGLIRTVITGALVLRPR